MSYIILSMCAEWMWTVWTNILLIHIYMNMWVQRDTVRVALDSCCEWEVDECGHEMMIAVECNIT